MSSRNIAKSIGKTDHKLALESAQDFQEPTPQTAEKCKNPGSDYFESLVVEDSEEITCYIKGYN